MYYTYMYNSEWESNQQQLLSLKMSVLVLISSVGCTSYFWEGQVDHQCQDDYDGSSAHNNTSC